MKRIHLIFLLLVVTFSLSAQKVFLRITAPENIVVGERFRVSYTLNSNMNDTEPTLQKSDKLDLVSGPKWSHSSQTSVIEGEVTTTSFITYTCVFVAKETGVFPIPKLTITGNNTTYNSNEHSIEVLPDKHSTSDKSISSDNSEDIFIRTELSHSSVYENGSFLVTIKLYSNEDIVGITKFNNPSFSGFLIKHIDLPEERNFTQENINGKKYQVFILSQYVLSPLYSGRLTIEQGSYDLVFKKKSEQKEKKSFFDSFFDSTSYTEKEIEVKSPEVFVDVSPFPSDKPLSFLGAVGDYLTEASVDKTTLSGNDSIKLTFCISGKGNVRLVDIPSLQASEAFHIKSRDVKVETKIDSFEISGTKTVEYVLVPTRSGSFNIHVPGLIYFDTLKKSYLVTDSKDFTITVEGFVAEPRERPKFETDKSLPESTSDISEITIVYALDVSSSMIAEDLKPNRLEAAKKTILNDINNRTGQRLGLVVFGKEGRVACSPTRNHNELNHILQNLDSIEFDKDGTDISLGLILSANALLKASESNTKHIVLLTDGMNTSSEISLQTIGDILCLYNIHLHSVGISSEEKAPYPAQTTTGETVYISIPTDIDERFLREMGEYYRALDNTGLDNAFQKLNKSIQEDTVETNRKSNNTMISLEKAALILEIISLDNK